MANQNSLGFRAAIREIAKVYGMPAEEIGAMSSRVMRQKDLLTFADPRPRSNGSTGSPDLQSEGPLAGDPRRRASRAKHFRHLSMHCGGVVIVPDEIRRYVPVEFTAKGLPVIQWEKDQTEEAGLVKIDLLGNRSLAVIRDALAAVARHTGREIDYASGTRCKTMPRRKLIRTRRHDRLFLHRIARHPALAQKTLERHAARPSRCRRCLRISRDGLVAGPASGNHVREDFIRRAQGDHMIPCIR